jgi:membrane protease YdiL (CAAX protease family)
LATIIEYSSYAITLIFVFVAIIHWIKNKIRPWRLIGFTFDKKGILEIAFGASLCGVAVSFIFFSEWGLNHFRILAIKAPDNKFIYFLIFIFIASFIEEFINRGLMVNGLKIIVKRNWLIILIIAILFGLGHTANPNANAISILSSSLGGVIYTIAFLGAKNIWFPWILHFFWNTFQFLFGFPVSGMEVPRIVVQTDVRDSILSGGLYGPEAGLIGIAARGIILAGILYYLKKHRTVDIKELFQ